MDIENTFAAEVFNAERTARIATAHGYPTTAADQIHGALDDLWGCGHALGYSRPDLQAIADRHVEWVDGNPQGRAFVSDNLIVFS